MVFLLLFPPRISLIVFKACFGLTFGFGNFVLQFFFASRKAVMAAFLEDLYLFQSLASFVLHALLRPPLICPSVYPHFI